MAEEKLTYQKFKKGDIYISKYGIGVIQKDTNYDYGEILKKSEDVKKYFSVGDRISGFCNGLFGRDDYGNKICVAIFEKFAVFQYEDGSGEILNFPESEKYFEEGLFWNYVETWRVH